MDGVVDGHELRDHACRALSHGTYVVREQEDSGVVVNMQERNWTAPEHDEGSVSKFPEFRQEEQHSPCALGTPGVTIYTQRRKGR